MFLALSGVPGRSFSGAQPYMAIFTESERAALRRALALGVTRVSYGGNVVEYRSLQEMRDLLRQMDADIDGDAAPKAVRQIRVESGKGL